MKKNNVRTFVVLLGCMLLACSCGSKVETKQQEANVRLFTVKSMGETTMQDFPGRVVSAEEVNMAFKVSGSLQRVYVKEGDRIRKGQLLAEVDPRDYKTQLDAVRAQYEQVKSEAGRVIALYADSVTTAEAYDKARYGLQQITAKYDNARNQLADTKVYAPFDGYVQKRYFDPPTVIAAGMPVLTVMTGGRQEIEINIPASTYMRRNEIASFTTAFAFLPERTLPLQLISMMPKANANQLFTVRLALPAGLSVQPSPGMNAMVNIAFHDTVDGHTEIPSAALMRQGEKSCVWVYLPSKGVVKQRIVQVERMDTRGNAVISSGLTAGEQVVTVGVHKLSENQKVKPLAPRAKTNIGGLL